MSLVLDEETVILDETILEDDLMCYREDGKPAEWTLRCKSCGMAVYLCTKHRDEAIQVLSGDDFINALGARVDRQCMNCGAESTGGDWRTLIDISPV